MSVLTVVSANTFEERGLGEHISRLKICYRDIAYTIKRKHKCSVLLLNILPIFLLRDFIAMLFLLTAFALESKCKSTNNNPTSKKYFASFTKICTFATWLSKITQCIE